MQEVLAAEGVRLLRDGRPLLDGIDLVVLRGQRWVILGPNGAGKTTLLSVLGARQHPSAGSVRVLGRPLGRVDVRDLWPLVGHVQGRHHPGARMDVRTLVLTGATGTNAPALRWRPTAAQEQRVDALLAQIGLAALAGRDWSTLSNGEQRRALIARALVPDPPLLLLDEPAAGLDLPARELLLDVLDVLATGERASVLVTHHVEEIPSTTTHALLLRDGRIVSAGPAAHVLAAGPLSEAFGLPLRAGCEDGRWWARRAPRP